MFWGLNMVAVFVLSAVFAGIVIPQILLIAFRRKIFDVPDERKIHSSLVPRLGGIAFMPVIFFSMALLLAVNQSLGNGVFLSVAGAESLPLAYAFCALLMLYLVGMADDLIGVRYSAKFFVQIVCGLMLIAGGVTLNDLHGMALVHSLPGWLSVPMTLFVTVFVINAVNLIDGLDGLASGLSGAAFLFYGLAFAHYGEYIYAMLAFATLGVLVPFYYYNVFGKAEKGRKIFMGDTGSLTIGLTLCFLSLRLSNVGGADADGANPFVVAFAPLLVPCLDVVRVYMHRVRNGKSPFLPDKNHIHHKLLAIGVRQRPAMVSIVLASVALTLANVVLSLYVNATLLLLGDVMLWTAANIALSRKIRARAAAGAKEEQNRNL